uniref:Uncharacterized protein n=2 Tax=unclassified Caudoviricetes TaxID=2788787 RepID=A0A8S5QJ97_9CAUD|nr:MAG TPA: hypothetical protein [Siphoviridae sp. ctVii20]DAE19358.1 MAG TPA: hypothetical protein [Siphoviridae sp. ctezl47]
MCIRSANLQLTRRFSAEPPPPEEGDYCRGHGICAESSGPHYWRSRCFSQSRSQSRSHLTGISEWRRR